TQVDLTGTEDGQQMSLDNILVALITGSSNSGVASGSTTAMIEEAVASGATSQLSGLVGQWAGLDVFEYKAGEGGLSNLSGGSLEVGTYVTDRIFVRVKQPIEVTQSGQEVTIEYRLLDWLKLIAQQNGTTSSSLNLLMQVDWR
ncbi:MAG: translocation/assembly module TamB domain-containing protein, partial [Calditrichota bacterium]